MGIPRSAAGQHVRPCLAANRQRHRRQVVVQLEKSDEFGWVSKAKSRLVARGFKQREGIDFGETFAPTVSSSYVGLLSAIASELDLDVCHFDVEQAFVQSKLDEDVFLRLPRGCDRLSGKVV